MSKIHKDPCCAEIGTCNTDPYNYLEHLVPVDVTTIVLGFVILIGTVISIVPMNIKLLMTKNVTGISFAMLLILDYNQWSIVVSLVMAEFSKIMACQNSFGKCWSNLISLYQAVAQFVCYFTFHTQYLYYEAKELGMKSKVVKIHVTEYFVFVAFMVLTIPGMIVPGIFYGPCDSVYNSFGIVFSTIAAITICIAWVPQIYATYKLKAVGSFSISAMLMQCPGCAITLIVTIMSGNQWYTWIQWIINFIVLFILCYLLVYYDYKNKSKLKNEQTVEGSEAKSLLDNQLQPNEEVQDINVA
ncbi:PQ_loop repeat-containing protein [Hexamita inflata]|uniref:PQ loop repeat-containing protein n=1 Tax=Hexamita inflata TaxID=28002 RepID=A0AA86P005_9EUKA|nr:PQ loop repeat-containing protein [Hexamita inflata]